jgi:hypothetical protein
MASGISKAKGRRHSRHAPKRKRQNMRTWANVKRRRARHAETSPNEKESMKHAVRWVSLPK